MRVRTWLAGPIVAASVAAASISDSVGDGMTPSPEVARRRGPEIFNAVHNSMRQWGSSLHHNGMSFFIATVPKGVLLHHGNTSPNSPTEPDWLAYEIEHAENFAHSRRGGPPGRGGHGPPPQGGDWDAEKQKTIKESHRTLELRGEEHKQDEGDEEEERHGYLHVYETTRALKFLYVDGMGGGKTTMGTLDSQDYLLRGKTPANDTDAWARSQRDEPQPPPKRKGPGGGGPMDEQVRAKELCALCKEWGLQGVIRMEAGFEIIKCDFSDGLEEVQALQRPEDTNRGPGGFGNLEFVRGLSERYQGIGSTRTIIDYSSMVSAFFFPVNMTNPDPKRQDLPRLVSVEQTQLAEIKKYLEGVISERRDEETRVIDWQDVSDLIVGRYADRLKDMAEAVDSIEAMAGKVNFLLTLFVDGSSAETTEDAIDRCSDFYLRSVRPATESDHLIHTAFKTVTHEICSTLFRVRDLVVMDAAPDRSSLAAAQSALGALMQSLSWTRFKRCPPCAINEVCVIPMWPMGTVEMYNNPRCSNGSDADDGERYWGGGPGGPRRPGNGRGGGGGPPPPLL
ncbi:hypothetical protein G7054_g2837 [Neopestalotiopsis clavispora]|nr:hypothetical protein G7054_g2837 [Neopestalotiopsis clavispora]